MKFFAIILTVLVLVSCASRDIAYIEDDGIIPQTWETGTSPGRKIMIENPIVYSINKPAAGNYPQGLYKYPINFGKDGFTSLLYTQTITWIPEVKKTFDTDTRYTAVIRLDPKEAAHTFKSITQADISGLPASSDFESITAKILGESLIIYINFPKTESTKVPNQLVFFDEFNGTELDKTKWGLSPSPHPIIPPPPPDHSQLGWIRHGRSSWNNHPNLVEIKDGYLYLNFFRDREYGEAHARVKPWGTEGQFFGWWPESSGRRLTRQLLADNWISAGAIRTMSTDYTDRKFEHGYGWYESRIKFPKLAGAGGAFWLMSMTFDGKGNKGQFGTEIDILETIGSVEGRWDYALHWGFPGGYDSYVKEFLSPAERRNIDIYDGEFHVFALDWSPSEYVFYINGIEMGRVPDNCPDHKNVRVNRNPNYLKLSVEGAYWDEPLPADFTNGTLVVDYVRVYNQPRIGN